MNPWFGEAIIIASSIVMVVIRAPHGFGRGLCGVVFGRRAVRLTPWGFSSGLGNVPALERNHFGGALAEGRRIVGFPHDAASCLIYYMAHDSHHRGQIVQLARLPGHPVSQATMSAMWQWPRRARE